MSPPLIESLDPAVSPDNRHLQTARAATSTEIGGNSDSGAHGDTLHIYASSSSPQAQQPTTKSSHSLPNEHELQHGSTGHRPRRSVDFSAADERANSQDSCAATAEHTQCCTDIEDTSSGRLGDYQHGNSVTTPPQPSRHNLEASRDESDAAVDNSEAPNQESVTEILSRLVPENSALRLSIDRRDSKMWLVDDDKVPFAEPFDFSWRELPSVLRDMRQKMAAGSIVIIEDLNIETCKALEPEYPLLDRNFLVEHMLRFDEPVSKGAAEKLQEHVRQHVGHPRPDLFGVEHKVFFNHHIFLHFDSPPSIYDESRFHLDLHWDWMPEEMHALKAMELLLTRPQWAPAFRYDQFMKSTAG